MWQNMPHSHMPVKHRYSCLSVEQNLPLAHNSTMKNLRDIRRQRHLSQAQLAEMAGLDQSTISKAENGEMNVTLEKIIAIASALHVQPAELFELPELHKRALAALDQLTGPDAQAALVVLETMARRDGGTAPEPKEKR